jgi:hypothetical protein
MLATVPLLMPSRKRRRGYSGVVIFLVSHDIWILSWIRKAIRAGISIKEIDLAVS